MGAASIKRFAAVAVVAVGVAAGVALSPAQARADAPYMGVDTWYALGTQINQADVVQLADEVVWSGLERAGYRILWLDAGWWDGQRNPDGSIAVDPEQWPNGMAWLAGYLHSLGLEAGIYEETGATACYNGGALGHVQQDMSTFAAWGFDAVKVDYCGDEGSLLRPPAEVYGQFEEAIQATGRPMILNACDPDTWDAYPLTGLDAWQWGPESGATSWRTDTDLTWPTGQPIWPHVLRNIDADAQHPPEPGHWNDPDYLVPGLLSGGQARAQIAMWAILAAPMIVSASPEGLPAQTLGELTNPQLIAISQDPAGMPGRPVRRQGSVQVWVKPLADGQLAVGLLNRGAAPQRIQLEPTMLGLGAGRMRVEEVFSGRRMTVRAFDATVPGQDAILLRVA
jgi:alpha-galactosidase